MIKIIITESQLNELKARSEKYLDQLLDKISKSGMGSLSDDEKDAMIRMSKDEDPEMDMDFIIKFWKSLFQEKFKINVNNEEWLINRIDTTPEIVLRIVNPSDGFTFYVIPFANNQLIMRLRFGEENYDFPMDESEVPRTKKEIDDFHYIFLKTELPELIKSVNTNLRGI